MNLVLGASGFIGSNVVKALLQKGEKVRALVRKNSSLDNLKDLDIELFYGDLLDEDSLIKAMSKVQKVFHVAALYLFWAKNKNDFFRINIEGTKNVLNSAKKAGVERLIYTSTMATLGGSKTKTLRNENSEFNLFECKDPYILSKYEAEKLVLDFIEKQKLDVVIVNPGGPLGWGDLKPTPTGKLLIEFLNGNIPGYMSGGINLVNIQDVAEGHILAGQNGKTGEKYLLTNKNLTLKETFQLFSKVTGLSAPRFKIPYFAGITFASVLESFAKITHTTPLLTKENIKLSNYYFFYDNSKAKKELGLVFSDVREGVKSATLYFIEKGLIKKKKAEKIMKFMKEDENEI